MSDSIWLMTKSAQPFHERLQGTSTIDKRPPRRSFYLVWLINGPY
jgi:hypothetical protein